MDTKKFDAAMAWGLDELAESSRDLENEIDKAKLQILISKRRLIGWLVVISIGFTIAQIGCLVVKYIYS